MLTRECPGITLDSLESSPVCMQSRVKHNCTYAGQSKRKLSTDQKYC